MKKWTSKIVFGLVLLTPAAAWAAEKLLAGGCPLGCC